MLRYRHFTLLLLPLILACAGISCASRHVTATSGLTQSTNVLTNPGVPWLEWQKSADAQATDARLKGVVSRTINSWVQRGIARESFGIIRSHGTYNKSHTFACYPFDKRHAPGRAIDVWVGDLNRDGRLDLIDACLFAKSAETPLNSVKGDCGVYGQANVDGDRLWVHIDVSGKTDRAGAWHTLQGESQPVLWSSEQRSLKARCRAWRLQPNRRNTKLLIKKQPSLLVFDAANQKLSLHPSLRVYVNNLLVKAYPVALGFDPINPKEKRDDYRTPEGEYIICDKNPNSRFHKSLRLNYPNARDAERGLRTGLIDRAIYQSVIKASRRKRTPPQDTPLGSDIMLHGGGGVRENWTWGCVALDNDAIDELFDFLPMGTRVKILPVPKTNSRK